MGDSQEEISDEVYRVLTAFKEEALSLSVEEGLYIIEHMNEYTKFLTELVNVDVNIEEEDNVLLKFSS